VGARVVLSLDGEIVTEVELSKAVTVVGRHPTCDICVDHPAISGRHMLFRVVNTTIYVEDLASTNGTKVNGLSTNHQVVHHLDLIEIGKHKLHFFDDAMLASGVANIESTVQTDFERTMLAAHVSEAVARPAPRPPAAEVDLSRTMAIPRDTLKHEVVSTGQMAAQAAETLALRVQSGARVGEIIALDQANTMLGTAGSDTALVVRRGSGFYLARFGGSRPPRLNHQDLGPGTHRLSVGDVIEVGGAGFEVMNAVR
jgi:pSer/pThr/pTyr-binding forkhead associated (FHA) protein